MAENDEIEEFEEVSNSTDDDEEFKKLLDDFITSELKDINTDLDNKKTVSKPVPAPTSAPSQPVKTPSADDDMSFLKTHEKNLYIAYRGFVDAINYIAQKHKISGMKPTVKAKELFPNYKPSVGKMLQKDILAGWDIMIKAYPDEVVNIEPDSSDDQLLDFAEAASENQLTLSIISYVETTIEMDGCEIVYQERLLKAERRKIEKEIYEEHQRRARRCRNYIREIEQKKFPINAEKLINNYFKTAQKDADGAYGVLTTNPATYSPIEVEKIKPRFFGVIKPRPQDGYRINKLIGAFLKKLKA